MEKGKYLFAGVIILTLLLAVGGCASGVSNEDFEGQISSLNEKIDALNLKIADSESQVTELSTISADRISTLSTIAAYQLWFDQYYSLGTYSFPDVKTFNGICGRLISEVNDGATVASWNIYIRADKAYYDLLETLPEDTGTWTRTDYDQWVELNEARSDALGQVGATLFNAISKKG